MFKPPNPPKGRLNMKELEKTISVCPSCFQEGIIQKIDAKIIEEDEKV